MVLQVLLLAKPSKLVKRLVPKDFQADSSIRSTQLGSKFEGRTSPPIMNQNLEKGTPSLTHEFGTHMPGDKSQMQLSETLEEQSMYTFL